MSTAKQIFSQRDRDLIESLVYDASLRPGFNALTDCLVWTDEQPLGLTREGHRVLATLWFGRTLMHQGLTFDDHPIDPEYCRQIWHQAIEEIPDWPGFKRLELDQKDKAFLTENLDRGGGFD